MRLNSFRYIFPISCALLCGGVVLSLTRETHKGIPVAYAGDNSKLSDETVKSLALIKAVSSYVSEHYVDPVPEQQLYKNALNGMIDRLDPHSSYLDPQQLKEMKEDLGNHFGGIGLQVQKDQEFLRVAGVMPGTSSEKVGIKQGDLILSANDTSLAGKTLDQAVRYLRGPAGSHVKIVVLRPSLGKKLDFRVTRQKIKIQRVFSRLDGNIIYIRLSEFSTKINSVVKHDFYKLSDELKKQGKSPQGIILDLRSDPGGRLDQAIAVVKDFINHGTIVSVKGRNPKQDITWSADGTSIIGKLPLVVLVNGNSASASEIVAAAIQDHRRGLLIGERTFGKGSVQTVIPLENDGALRLTTARYYTPLNRSIQGEGVTPDFIVGSTPASAHDETYHESDMAFALQQPKNTDIKSPDALPDSLVKELNSYAHEPNKKWPKQEFNKPNTDFQLHQAEEILNHVNLKFLSGDK